MLVSNHLTAARLILDLYAPGQAEWHQPQFHDGWPSSGLKCHFPYISPEQKWRNTISVQVTIYIYIYICKGLKVMNIFLPLKCRSGSMDIVVLLKVLNRPLIHCGLATPFDAMWIRVIHQVMVDKSATYHCRFLFFLLLPAGSHTIKTLI